MYTLYKLYCQQKELQCENTKRTKLLEGMTTSRGEDTLKAKYNTLQEEIIKKAATEKVHKAQIELLNNEITQKNNEIADLNKSIEEMNQKLTGQIKAYKQIEESLEDAISNANSLNKNKEIAEQNNTELIKELKNVKEVAKSLELKNNQLEELIANQENTISQFKAQISKLSNKSTPKHTQEDGVHNEEESNNPLQESDVQSSALDINDENIPVIVQQLLNKDELKNKALLQMFNINSNGKYAYKDVLKCMAALFFHQRYSGVIKSAFEIWLNSAITLQKQNDEDEQNESAHSEPFHEMIEGDIVELRKPEFVADKKPKSKNIN